MDQHSNSNTYTVDRAHIKQLLRAVADHDEQRLALASRQLHPTGRQILRALPALLHFNQASLPGYIRHCPAGIFHYQPDKQVLLNLVQLAPAFDLRTAKPHQAQIHGLYLMGSTGSIAQTSTSDIDFWVCVEPSALDTMQAKIDRLSAWAEQFDLELQGFAVHQRQFQHVFDKQPGHSQSLLLLEEFYRSACRMAGKPLLWWLIPPEQSHSATAEHLKTNKYIKRSEYIDFGPSNPIPSADMYAACLHAAEQSFTAPYKALLKLALLITYLDGSTQLADRYKHHVRNGNRQAWDVYLAHAQMLFDHFRKSHCWPQLHQAWMHKTKGAGINTVKSNQLQQLVDSWHVDTVDSVSANTNPNSAKSRLLVQQQLMECVSLLFNQARRLRARFDHLPEQLQAQERRVLQLLQLSQTQPDFLLPAFRPDNHSGWLLLAHQDQWQIRHHQQLLIEHHHIGWVLCWLINHNIQPSLENLTDYQHTQVIHLSRRLQQMSPRQNIILLNVAADLQDKDRLMARENGDQILDLTTLTPIVYPAPVGPIFSCHVHPTVTSAVAQLLTAIMHGQPLVIFTTGLLGSQQLADHFTQTLHTAAATLRHQGQTQLSLGPRSYAFAFDQNRGVVSATDMDLVLPLANAP